MKKREPDRSTLLTAVVAALLAAPTFGADSVGYGLAIGVSHSDNIARLQDKIHSNTSAVAELRLHMDKQSERWTADIEGNLQYFDYFSDIYGKEVVGRFDGEARLRLVPGRVDWIVQDSFGIARIDQFAADSPTNRQTVNYFSTGPQASLRLGRQGFLQVAGRYSRVEFEESTLDNDRYVATLSLGRNLSSRLQLSLNAANEEIHYPGSAGAGDYTRQSAYLRYQQQGARTQLGLNVGASTSDLGTDRISSPLVQMNVDRQVSNVVRMTLLAGYTLTDSSDAVRDRTLASAGQNTTSPATITGDTFERRYGGLGWQFEHRRTSAELQTRYTRDAFELQPELNQRRWEAYGSVSRRMTPSATLSLFGSTARSSYLNMDFVETYSSYGLSLRLRIGQRFSLNTQVERVLRSVSGALAASEYGFNENRGSLKLEYYRSR